MAATAKKVIEILLSQVGYHETKKNVTKYAAALDKTTMYNGKKQGTAWCDIFFDWAVWTAAGEDTKKAEYVLCQPDKSCGAGCRYSYAYYKAKKRIYKTPQPGDQIFFGTSETNITHTGGVISVDGKKITTVEGNKDDQVKKCTYTLGGNNKIFGFGRPRYDAEPAVLDPKPEQPAAEKTASKPGTPAKIAAATDHNKNDRGQYEVTASVLNVRQNASMTATILTEIKRGDIVTCYGYSKYSKDNEKWLAILTAKGVEGYCCAKYLNKI